MTVIQMPPSGRRMPVQTLGERMIDMIDLMRAEHGVYLTMRFLLQQAERIQRDDYESMLDPDRVFPVQEEAKNAG